MLHARLLKQTLNGRCQFNWERNGLQLDLTWERQGRIIFMRPRNAPLSLLWSFSTNQYPPNDSQIIGNLQWALRRREVTRCHLFGKQLIFINRNKGVLVDARGRTVDFWGRLPLGAAFHLPNTQFPRFRNPRYSLLAPPELIETSLQQLSDDSTSDFSGAKRWLDAYEDGWSNVVYTGLETKQIQSLLKGLWFIFADEQTHASQKPLIRNAKNNTFRATINAKEWLIPKRLIEIFNEHCGLLWIKRERGYYAANWSNLGQSRTLQLSHEMPTVHQKLEALLLWQEFLQDKLPESEIEALLPAI